MTLPLLNVEAIHPDLWRASQLGSSHGRTVTSGHAALDAELPGRGWPAGALTEVIVPQPGCGELRLLKAALESVATRPVFVLQPPHRLQPAAFTWWGMGAENIRVLKAATTADSLWAAEQILRAGAAGALLFWQQQARPEALRRLHLAAQRSDTLLFLFRPTAAANSTSPAPLRISIDAAPDGVNVSFIKRRGPHRDEPVFVALSPSPVLLNRHAPLDRRSSATPDHREFLPQLVHAGV